MLRTLRSVAITFGAVPSRDEELLVAARLGKKDALAMLIDRHRPMVVTMVEKTMSYSNLRELREGLWRLEKDG
jgi:hypothetical protein